MAYFDKYGVEFSDDRKTLVECPKVFKGEYIIPNNVTSIEHNAFYKCIGLTAVTIPDSVTNIGDGAFWDCSNLTSVTIPNSVTYIGYSAFQGCNCLMSVHINDIAAWCAISFMNSSDTGYGHSNPSFCHSNPLFYAYNLYLNDELITDLTIPNSVKSIGDNAFYGCSCLTSVKIPDSVKYIGEGAFAGCWGLTSVTIPKSVTYIGNNAFYGCSGLTSVHINDIAAWSALSFNSQPLHYAHNLYLNDELITNLTIPNSVKSIGDGAFAGCSCLTSVKIPNSVAHIGNRAFAGCTGITSVTIPNSVTYIGYSAFAGCSRITSLFIPNSVTNIGLSAFKGCSSLTFVKIPNSFISIRGGAFGDCSNLTSVTIPNSVTYIENYAFAGCSSLISLTIPDSVSHIGEGAFAGCTGITSVTIPDSVELIEKYAFEDCNNLGGIYISKGQKARFAQMEGLKDWADIIVERDNEELSILLHIAKGYELGIGLQKSLPQALVIYMQAAEKGCAEAAYHLGEWYEHGEHVPQDLTKALEYFQQAAKSGFTDAQTHAEKVQKTIEEKMAEETQRQEEERKRIEEERRQEAERKRQQEERQRAEEQRKQEEEKKRKMEEEKRKEEQERREQQRKEEQQLLEMLQDSILFFDTETTGVPKLYKAPITNSSNWPRLVQLAWIMVDKDGNVLKKKSVIIKPSGFTIPSDAAAVHGITTERAQREGQPLDTVMEEFMNDMQLAASVVGHNIDFDMHIVGAELYRLDMDYDLLMDKPCTCTMKSSTDFCAIPNPNTYFGGYKWPSLQELYRKLFGYEFTDAHDALADISATKECFFELKRRGIIQ